MTNGRGVAIAGNVLVDYVKQIDVYPKPGMLANILSTSRAVGGCVPNTAIDLARMGGGMPVYAYGRVGADENGDYVLGEMRAAGVRVEGVIRDSRAATSFSDAMCARDTGERTFFHCRGCNALMGPEDVPLDALPCDMLHVGYIMLLDRFDAPDEECGTVMARFLRDAQRKGVRTSVDAVSDSSGRFAEKIGCVLPYCDYAIMNEVEACAAVGLCPRDAQGRLLPDAIRRALDGLMKRGVCRRAVIHCPEGAFCEDAQTGFTQSPSFRLPEGYIQGSVGAGDAFCAGCLHEIARGACAEDMLSFAAAAAAASLSRPDSVSGMRGEDELYQMIKTWERG